MNIDYYTVYHGKHMNSLLFGYTHMLYDYDNLTYMG